MATQTIPAYELNYGSRRYNQQVADRNLHLFAAQQRARRGPTPEVFCSKRLDNSRLVKAADPVRVREMRIFTAAMTVLFVIVMFYGLQHFSAIEYGYKVEAQKQQRLDAPKPGQVVRGESQFDSNAPVMAEASPMPLGR
jgi:hypothetical protein